MNGQRSNYPFGECENGSYVASSGSVKPLGRRGRAPLPDIRASYSSPTTSTSGDFARSSISITVAACYNDINSSWHSDMLAGNSYPFFQHMGGKPAAQNGIDRTL